MAGISFFARQLLKPQVLSTYSVRCLALTSMQRLKEIHQTVDKGTMVIEAVQVPSPNEPLLLDAVKACGTTFCPECTLGLEIKHTDVLILSQYVRSDGCMLPRRVTGLCKRQQKRMQRMVAMAQKSGLMPNLAPAWSKKDPKARFQWKKFNKYFDESTIKF